MEVASHREKGMKGDAERKGSEEGESGVRISKGFGATLASPSLKEREIEREKLRKRKRKMKIAGGVRIWVLPVWITL